MQGKHYEKAVQFTVPARGPAQCFHAPKIDIKTCVALIAKSSALLAAAVGRPKQAIALRVAGARVLRVRAPRPQQRQHHQVQSTDTVDRCTMSGSRCLPETCACHASRTYSALTHRDEQPAKRKSMFKIISPATHWPCLRQRAEETRWSIASGTGQLAPVPASQTQLATSKGFRYGTRCSVRARVHEWRGGSAGHAPFRIHGHRSWAAFVARRLAWLFGVRAWSCWPR